MNVRVKKLLCQLSYLLNFAYVLAVSPYVNPIVLRSPETFRLASRNSAVDYFRRLL
jgi:hypothetical protein